MIEYIARSIGKMTFYELITANPSFPLISDTYYGAYSLEREI